MVTRSQVEKLDSGVDAALDALQSALAQKVYAEQIPLFGDELKQAFEAGEDALEGITVVKEAIKQGLRSILALADAEITAARVDAELDAALAQFGLGTDVVDAVLAGSELAVSFDTHREYAFAPGFAVAGDMGMPGLDLEASGSLSAMTVYDLAFTMGVGLTGDAWLETGSAEPELSLRLAAEVDQFGASARLGFLGFSADDLGSTLDGAFAVDLVDPDGRLSISDLGGDIIETTFTGAAHLGMGLRTDMGSAALPRASADLLVDWSFDASRVVAGDDNAAFGNAPTVRLDNVAYDFGTFVEDFVKPILSQLVPILQPIHQALAVLRSDISFLEAFPGWQDLFDKTGAQVEGQDAPDGRITLLDLLKLAMPEQNLVPVQRFVEIVDSVVMWSEFFLDKDFGPEAYALGGFELTADIRDTALALADAAPTAIAAAADLEDFLSSLSGSWSEVDAQTGLSARDVLEDMLGLDAFRVPILTDPAEAARLLLGGNVELFGLDLPAMSFAVPRTDLLTVPVFPGFDVKLQGEMGVALDLGFGYDTRGLEQYAASLRDGTPDLSKVLNGLFVSDIDGNGADVPEAVLSASVDLLLQASLALASAGGAGGVQGRVDLDLDDAVGGTPADGRVYLDEMASVLAANPFALFDASGLVTAGFSAFVRVGAYEVWRYASPRITLAEFSFDDSPAPEGGAPAPRPAPELAALEGDHLLLNVGSRAIHRTASNALGEDETLFVSGGAEGVTVRGFGRTQAFASATAVSGDGGSGNDELVASDAALAATLTGGEGDDVLFGGALADVLDGGSGRDLLRGGAGDDVLRGGAGDDVLDGNLGADTIDGGDGVDVLTFEAARAAVRVDLVAGTVTGGGGDGDTFTGIEVFEGSDLADAGDAMIGGAGNDALFGLAGDDRLEGGAGEDFLAGGAGADVLEGGAGADVLSGGAGDDRYHVDHVGDVTDDEMTGPRGGFDTVLASADHAIGAGIEDLTLLGTALRGTGNDLANRITGTVGDNVLDGGGGADTLVGGLGDDLFVLDHAGDRVVDGFEEGRDEIRLFTSAATSGEFSLLAQWAIHLEDLSLADDARSIRVVGNDHANRLTGNEAADELLGMSGSDILSGGGGNDTLDGGKEADVLDGGAGDDLLIVRDVGGGDILAGGLGDDVFSFYSNSRVGYGSWTASASSPASPVRITDFAGAGPGGDSLRIQVPGAYLVFAGYRTFDPADDATFQFPNQGDGLSDVIFDNLAGTTRVAVDVDDDGSFGERDLLIVLEGDHDLAAEDFVDTFNVQRGSLDPDSLVGTHGPDRLYGSSGADTLVGLEGDDQLAGEGGDDALLGGPGRDWLQGGAGDDTLDGGDGDDGPTSSLGYRSGLYGGAGNDVVDGGAGDDVLYGDGEASSGEGDGHDTLHAGDGDDAVYGGGGNDAITGGAGIDQIDGGAGNDEIDGGSGIDQIYGQDGNDTI